MTNSYDNSKHYVKWNFQSYDKWIRQGPQSTTVDPQSYDKWIRLIHGIPR